MLSLIHAFKLCVCQDPRIARAYPTKFKITVLFPLVSLSVDRRSRGAEWIRQGEGRSRPEEGARTKLFDQEFQFRESHTDAEMKKTMTESPEKRMVV